MINDTIVALSTPRGRGAIAIVRVCGNNALKIAKKLSHKKQFTPRHASLCMIYDKNQEIIDEALIIYFQAPKSFTGEDMVEFQLHGGDSVAMMLIDEILTLNARVANPGEFSKRAFINGKMDLTKAEAIAKLIDAKSKESAKLLARVLKGELKDFVEKAKENLIEILAHSEVMIDYADEDIPQNIKDTLNQKLSSLQQQLEKIYRSSQNRDGFFSGYKIAIIGKPNVGKSSLLNAMLFYDRAIVSEIEGTTRDSIEENLTIGTHSVKIIDTAGIRQNGDEIEKIGIQYSKKIIKEADVIIALFDISRDFDSNDQEILELLQDVKKPTIFVLNKNDLSANFDELKLKNYKKIIKLSCKNDIKLLEDELKMILDSFSNSNEQILISKRQIDIVKNTISLIQESFLPLQNEELEIFSFHINEAIKEISLISKPFEYSEVLDSMFGSFCLGK